MTLKIIGAGLGRTGTMSLKKALEQLGYDKCYHMAELLGHPEHLPHWRDLHEQRETDLDALFAGYRATVDFPGAIFYRQLLDHYPEAKVVLSVRDPESWYESTRATIRSAAPTGLEKVAMLFRLPFSPKLRRIIPTLQLGDEMIWKAFFQDKFDDRRSAIERFEQHTQEVKETVPADQLLVYELGQGWEPICTFLGHQVPEEPFPHINKRADFAAKRNKIMSGEPPDIA